MTEDRLARTRRSDGNTYGHPHCRRCGQCWPCTRAGRVDWPARRRRLVLIAAAGVLGLLAAGCVLWAVWL